jgi:hypothetical protein
LLKCRIKGWYGYVGKPQIIKTIRSLEQNNYKLNAITAILGNFEIEFLSLCLRRIEWNAIGKGKIARTIIEKR